MEDLDLLYKFELYLLKLKTIFENFDSKYFIDFATNNKIYREKYINFKFKDRKNEYSFEL